MITCIILSGNNILQRFSLCVPHKKVMPVWNNMKENKWWKNIWIDYFFYIFISYSILSNNTLNQAERRGFAVNRFCLVVLCLWPSLGMCWWINVWVPHVHLQNATINHSATACNAPWHWQQRMDEIKEPLCINTPPRPVHTTGNCRTTNANTNDIMTPAQPSSTYEKHHTDKLSILIHENNRREDSRGLLKKKEKKKNSTGKPV